MGVEMNLEEAEKLRKELSEKEINLALCILWDRFEDKQQFMDALTWKQLDLVSEGIVE